MSPDHQNDRPHHGLFDGYIEPGKAFSVRWIYTRFSMPGVHWLGWHSKAMAEEWPTGCVQATLPAVHTPIDFDKCDVVDLGKHGRLMRSTRGYPLPALSSLMLLLPMRSIETLLRSAFFADDIEQAAFFLANGPTFGIDGKQVWR